MYNVHMGLRFEWDPKKDAANRAKHGVSFSEASTIFYNFPLQIYHDPDHSEEEPRYIAIGVSDQDRVLLVVHIENTKGTVIRIISARRATKKEKRDAFGGGLP